MVEEKQEGGVFYPPPPGKIGLSLCSDSEVNKLLLQNGFHYEWSTHSEKRLTK